MARVALICAFAGVAAASGAVELTPDNFDKEVLQSGKSVRIFLHGVFKPRAASSCQKLRTRARPTYLPELAWKHWAAHEPAPAPLWPSRARLANPRAVERATPSSPCRPADALLALAPRQAFIKFLAPW